LSININAFGDVEPTEANRTLRITVDWVSGKAAFER